MRTEPKITHDPAQDVAHAARVWLDEAAAEYAAGHPWLANTLAKIGHGYAQLAVAEVALASMEPRERHRIEAFHAHAGAAPWPETPDETAAI